MAEGSRFDLKKIFWAIFIAFISISFVAFFTVTGDPISKGSVQVGKVDGHPVFDGRDTDYSRQFHQLVESYRSRGVEMSEPVENYLRTQAFNQVAMHRIVMGIAEDASIIPGDDQLLQAIRQKFFAKDGRIDENAWAGFKMRRDVDALKQRFEREAREELQAALVVQLGLFEHVPVTRAEVFEHLDARRLLKKALVAVLPIDSKVEAGVTEGEMRSFYESHKSNYEGRAFDAVKPKVAADFLKENEALVRARVQAQLSQAIQQKLTSGEFKKDFRAAAAAAGMTVSASDWFHVDSSYLADEKAGVILDGGPDTMQDLLSRNPGDVVGPVDTGRSLAVVMISDAKIEALGAFGADVQKQVQQSLSQRKFQSAILTWQEQLFRKHKVVSQLGDGARRR